MSKRIDEMKKIGRNDPCHCNSGKKYKKCHLNADEDARQLENKKREAAVKKSKECDKKKEKDADDPKKVVVCPRTSKRNQNQNVQRFNIPRRSNG